MLLCAKCFWILYKPADLQASHYCAASDNQRRRAFSSRNRVYWYRSKGAVCLSQIKNIKYSEITAHNVQNLFIIKVTGLYISRAQLNANFQCLKSRVFIQQDCCRNMPENIRVFSTVIKLHKLKIKLLLTSYLLLWLIMASVKSFLLTVKGNNE